MSAPINDGGPAFPAPMFTRQADGQPMCPQEFGLGGMTLRDWFAGQALQSYLAGRNSDARDSNAVAVAVACYKYADAMLAAREPEESAT